MNIKRVLKRAGWLLKRTPYRYVRKGVARLFERNTVRQRRQEAGPLELTQAERSVVAELRQHGYAMVTHLLDPLLLHAVGDRATQKAARLQPVDGPRLNPDKDFWEHLLDEDRDADGRQPSESPFVSLAASEPVLRVAGSYLGDPPLLDHVFLLHSTYKPGPYRVSQLWHRDYDDTRLLKLFVYLTDCEEVADGPFTFIPAGLSKRIGFSMHSHRDDAQLGIGDPDKVATKVRAKRLTAFMVDTTRCYHMGSRVQEGHERLLYMAAFATYPKYISTPAVRFRLNGTETPLQRVALSHP